MYLHLILKDLRNQLVERNKEKTENNAEHRVQLVKSIRLIEADRDRNIAMSGFSKQMQFIRTNPACSVADFVKAFQDQDARSDIKYLSEVHLIRIENARIILV